MKMILIFEPLSGGHRAGYIRWLADAVRKNPPSGHHFVFVVDAAVDIPASTALFANIFVFGPTAISSSQISAALAPTIVCP